MCKKRMKEVLSIYRAYFRRNFMRKKPVERAELSCRTWFSQTDGILSPQEWIDIARGAGVRAIAITDFQGVEGFKEAAQAVEKLRREAGRESLPSKCFTAWRLCWRTGVLFIFWCGVKRVLAP